MKKECTSEMEIAMNMSKNYNEKLEKDALDVVPTAALWWLGVHLCDKYVHKC